MLEVKLLGQFSLRLDDREILIPSRPAQALLAYLLLHPAAHRREKLAGLVWSDASEANARRNLRQALWQLRRALGEGETDAQDYIVSDDITIAFAQHSPYTLDVSVLESAADERCRTAELMAAASVYAGELLPGFYDDWVVLERERLQGVFDRRLTSLLARLMGEERWQETIDWAQRWVATGHVPEPAYRAMMVAHSRLGEGAAAAAAYQRCQRALRDELGVEPSAETLRLYELLRAGRRLPLPTLPVITASPPSAPAINADDAADGSKASGVEADPGDPPFKGLPYFDEDDAGIFFGREELTARLLARLAEQPAVVAVVGASGSGKSSVLRAGLVPAARAALGSDARPRWAVHVITPTSQPLEALATSLAATGQPVTATATLVDDLARDSRTLRLAALRLLATPSKSTPQGLLLVVDQFEELFTLCRRETIRRAFIENLFGAAWDAADEELPTGPPLAHPVALIIALRADFYPHCSQYPGLRSVLASRQEYIGAMNAAELRRAIQAPAALHNWRLEPGLVDLILRDAGDEPGALPLLSHALLETWRRRRGRTLTLGAYAEAGGVQGAIAKAAEHTYRGLPPESQAAARAILLRLTEVGEGNQGTRRRANLAELVPAPGGAAVNETVLQTLADARLITVGAGTVELAHEALIREWSTLQGWLAEDREGLQLHRRLMQAAGAWDALGRDPAELYRGARLAQASEWAATHPGRLNALEEAYLAASVARAEGDAAEREQQRERELASAQAFAAAQREAAQRLHRRALLLTAALVLSAVLAIAAGLFARQAYLNAVEADEKARIARAREWASAARNNLDADPERSILLALQAVNETYQSDHMVLPEAQEALHRAVAASRLRFTLTGHVGAVTALAYSPTARQLATVGEDGQLRLWDPSSGQLARSFTVHPYSPPLGLAFSPDGKRVASVSTGDGVRVWDVVTRQAIIGLGSDRGRSDLAHTYSVAFSPDGRLVASGTEDGSVRVWDPASGEEALKFSFDGGEPGTGAVSVAFSPDARLLAAGRAGSGPGPAGEVVDLSTGRVLYTLFGSGIRSLVFDPDGSRLATAGEDRNARIWDSATGALVSTLSGHTGEVTAVAFSPDGGRLATASLDGTVRVWDPVSGRTLIVLAGHAGAVDAVAFDPGDGGATLATGGVDGSARIWDLTADHELYTISPPGPANGITSIGMAAGPASGASGGTSDRPSNLVLVDTPEAASLWLVARWPDSGGALPSPPRLQAVLDPGTSAKDAGGTPVALLSPDGQRVAVSGQGSGASVLIRDVASGNVLLRLDDRASPARAFAFSADGKRLLAANDNREAHVWDAVTGKLLQVLAGHSAPVTAVAANFDGSRLATGSEDGEIIVWNGATGIPLYSLNMAEADTRPAVLGPDRGGVLALAFSPDGRLLAAGGQENKVRAWDVAGHTLLFALTGHTAGVRSIAFSPDGGLLASGSADTTTKVWDLSTRSELFALTGHTDAVTSVAFTPDGRELATGSADGTVRFYLVRVEDLVRLALTRVTRDLTESECRQYLHVAPCPGP